MISLRTAGLPDPSKLRLLYPLNVWALSFGCAVGWGAFVMPGTLFLPNAGPIGSAMAVFIGGLAMLVIGANFCFMAEKYKGNGGIYAYTKKKLGRDHAFLAAWALVLAYLSLLWANATAFILIGRYFVGDVLQWGFHYMVAGYDVYFGEVLVTILIQVAFGFLVGYAKKVAAVVRTILAVTLLVSVVVLFVGVVLVGGFGPHISGFAPGVSKGIQILNIAMLAPWMYVGFETVTNEVKEFRFSVRKIFERNLLCHAHIRIGRFLTGKSRHLLTSCKCRFHDFFVPRLPVGDFCSRK